MPTLVLIRGLPGSGKSTIAKKYQEDYNALHIEADQFFIIDGEYKFDSKFLSEAHDWCYSCTAKALRAGVSVIVSNTFTKLWEMERYIGLSTKIDNLTIDVVEMRTQYQSIHNVPVEKVEQMKARWENISDDWLDQIRSYSLIENSLDSKEN